MYVKILDHSRNRAAVIYDTDPTQPVHYGRQRLERDPSELSWAELTEVLEVAGDSMDRTAVGSHPTGHYDPTGDTGRPFWSVGWVRFHKPGDDLVHLVCATSPIYLMDESGKTVESIRGD